MYIVDQNFYNLCSEIKEESLESIYLKIKEHYINLSSELKDSMESFFAVFPYWGKLNHHEDIYEELYNRAKSLKDNIDDYIWLYKSLEDYRSKQVLYAILNNWYNFDFINLKSCRETNFLHYFDMDIVHVNKDEVIVDLGAYTGDTIEDYFKTYGTDKYKKIFCFEITDDSFNKLTNNLGKYPNMCLVKKGIEDAIGMKFIQFSSTDHSANTIREDGQNEVMISTIDEEIKDKITLIKMDIEGSEQKALMGAKSHIVKEHPKLLISVYHNHTDLIEIPKMINKLNKDYKFYLRYYGNNVFPTEIVFYAI